MSISVIKAEYIDGLVLKITFSDNTQKDIDFKPFLSAKEHPIFKFYRKVKNFKQFSIENGKLVWGEDWDLIFPTVQLYEGKISN